MLGLHQSNNEYIKKNITLKDTIMHTQSFLNSFKSLFAPNPQKSKKCHYNYIGTYNKQKAFILIIIYNEMFISFLTKSLLSILYTFLFTYYFTSYSSQYTY